VQTRALISFAVTAITITNFFSKCLLVIWILLSHRKNNFAPGNNTLSQLETQKLGKLFVRHLAALIIADLVAIFLYKTTKSNN